MIYCVIPQALADELYERMVSYYENDPNVTVIIDRREGPDRRRPGDADDYKEQRELRDRRHRRIPGTFPSTYSGD
jgi:hypothetical protein